MKLCLSVILVWAVMIQSSLYAENKERMGQLTGIVKAHDNRVTDSARAKHKRINELVRTNPQEALRLVGELTDEERQILDEDAIRTMAPRTVIGKVIDTDGRPIPDSQVTLELYQYSGAQSAHLEKHILVTNTNAEGTYQFVCEKARSASVSAFKPGYAAVYRPGVGTVIGGAPYTKDRGVVTLRKQNPLSFLLMPSKGHRYSSWIVARGTNQVTESVDLLAKLGDTEKTRIPRTEDIVIAVSQTEANGDWMVEMSATNGTDGLILSRSYMYYAPPNDYGRSCRFSVTNFTESQIYLYTRTRVPAIYTRLEMEYRKIYDKQRPAGLKITVRPAVNPYGERTFEYDERFDTFWREKPKWIEDAKAALREGRYPQKIDIDALIKAEAEGRMKKGSQ